MATIQLRQLCVLRFPFNQPRKSSVITKNEGMPALRRTRSAVTLKDVAERVGVTAAAASMALAGRGRISDQPRGAVGRPAAELGYVPSSAGRALRKQRSGAVALIVPN